MTLLERSTEKSRDCWLRNAAKMVAWLLERRHWEANISKLFLFILPSPSNVPWRKIQPETKNRDIRYEILQVIIPEHVECWRVVQKVQWRKLSNVLWVTNNGHKKRENVTKCILVEIKPGGGYYLCVYTQILIRDVLSQRIKKIQYVLFSNFIFV